MYWDLRASGLLTCCVVLSESFYLSGLCAFSLSTGEDASLFYILKGLGWPTSSQVAHFSNNTGRLLWGEGKET